MKQEIQFVSKSNLESGEAKKKGTSSDEPFYSSNICEWAPLECPEQF
jgi:hypothetical protein